MIASEGSFVSPLYGPMMNRRSVPFGALLVVSIFFAARQPRHAPYPVAETSAVIVGLLVGFLGLMVAMLQNRVGSMELETKTMFLTLRIAGREHRFSLDRVIEFADFGIPEAVPYPRGCQLLFLRQGGESASLWYTNANPDDVARWRALSQALAGPSSLRVDPDAGRALHLLLRGTGKE